MPPQKKTLAKVKRLRKSAGQTRRGILLDDHKTAGRVVKSVRQFRMMTKTQRKRADVKKLDTKGGYSLTYDRKRKRRKNQGTQTDFEMTEH